MHEPYRFHADVDSDRQIEPCFWPIPPHCGELFRQPLREQINLKHPLVRLTDLIEWDRIDAVCISHFKTERGRRATSPRLIYPMRMWCRGG